MQDIGRTATSIRHRRRAAVRANGSWSAMSLAARMGPDHGGFLAFLYMFE
jgi:hypothetical protein